VFVATGTAIFHGAVLERGSEVRVHATVHLRTRLEPGAMVLIGWVAVGDPGRILPPDRHDEIWEVQKPLNFPEWVYGLDRSTPDLMRRITRRLSEALGAHADDAVIDG
jgi:carbonic anhydrase/acetyltransferase-like protein (isoleucine patch superfamily)